MALLTPPVASCSGAALQQSRPFSKEAPRPGEQKSRGGAEMASPAAQEQGSNGGSREEGTSGDETKAGAEEVRRGSAEGASTSADTEQSDSSSRSAWTISEEYARAAAEMRRVAGLNKMEAVEKAAPDNPLTWVSDVLRFVRGRLAVWAMKRVNPDFDEAEFLEGARDAYFIVTRLWGEQDFDTMRPMMSRILLEALRGTTSDYAKNHLTMRIEPASDIEAAVDNIDLMGQGRADWYGLPEEDASGSVPPEGLGVLDPAAAAPAGAAAPIGQPAAATATIPPFPGAAEGPDPLHAKEARMANWYYVILTVRFRANEISTIVNAGGAIVQQLKDRRQQLWRFCWGPLHGSELKPVPDLSQPSWRLLDLK